jgi:hypothetical protein
MLTQMTEEDWAIALAVFGAAQSRRGERQPRLERHGIAIHPRSHGYQIFLGQPMSRCGPAPHDFQRLSRFRRYHRQIGAR